MLSDLIRVFDILSSVLIVLSLYLVTKTYKAWLIYTLSCVPFTIVCIYNRNPGLTIMGIVLLSVGIRNYILGKRSKKETKI